ncbi:response regulator transcription factor [Nitrosomonas aestuarii]|uniref:response regulator transcription factor n=1 Tax=Nitrosomonas aestuarii TaxID=52441 RepID=UPI000D305620|nr:helix-turn-helix transcriptional regulator [Nitrosomonas aestuarii]PTN13235.1 regulatory LuxR family protein [Nitrosomonas aestuarii]
MLSNFEIDQIIAEVDDSCLISFKNNGKDCFILPRDLSHADERNLKQYSGLLLLGDFVLDGIFYRVVTKHQEISTNVAGLEEAFDPGSAISLTERELQIATLVAKGFLNKQIAVKLSLSVYTVSTHLRRIFAKYGVHNRTALAAKIKNL